MEVTLDGAPFARFKLLTADRLTIRIGGITAEDNEMI